MEKTLDKLEDKKDNPNKYKHTDFGLAYKVYVPKFRILFSANPLDIRFESKSYTVYLNGSIMSNIKSRIDYYIKDINNIKNKISVKLYSFTNTILKLKTKIPIVNGKVFINYGK